MEIPALVDLSEIDDINEFADIYYAGLTEKRRFITTSSCIVKGKINEYLQERRDASYEAISAYVNTNEFEKSAENDYEIRCFRTASNIYQLERGSENTIFNQIEYVDDFCKIYEKVCHYFRRIQLGMQRELCFDCMQYFDSKSLSVMAVVQMLLESDLGGMEIIASKLIEYYCELERYKEAMYIAAVFEEQGREQYKDSFTSQKADIQGKIKLMEA